MSKFFKSILFFFKAIFFLVSIPAGLFSQSSFQLQMDSTGHWLEDIVVNEEGKTVLLISENNPQISRYFYLMPINGQPGVVSGWKLALENKPILGISKKAGYFNDNVCVSYTIPSINKSSVSCVNIENGTYWSKRIRNAYLGGAVFTNDGNGNIIIANRAAGSPMPYPNSTVIEFYKVTPLGDVLWKKGIILKPNNQLTGYGAEVKEMVRDSEGNLYITGMYGNNASFETGQFVVKIDSLGNPMVWTSIPDHVCGKMVVTDDGLYLIDKGFFEYYWGPDPFERKHATLIKLRHDLDIIWAKKYEADNFEYATANIMPASDGHLFMTHSTVGLFPVILTKIDAQGNILSQKGYPNYTPRMHILNDGSFFLASRESYNAIGQTNMQPVIAKTDAEGNISGCSNYPTCLREENISIQSGILDIDTITVLDLEAILLEIEPDTFSFSEYCGFPPAPLPDFNFPSSLCLNDTASTTHTYNRLANAREWRLAGPGVDSVLVDSFNFSYRFTMPGEYLLRQTVWVLGCSSSFEKTITVLPPLEAAIAPAHLCPDEPQALHVETNRPVSSYLWSTGGSTVSLPVQVSGTYAVQVSDGVCLAADTLQVEVVAEWIGSQTPLQLPPDTTVCHTDLPFRLVPQSPFSDSFFLASDLAPADTFYLPSPGDYRIGMTAFGCYFYENFNLEVDCRAGIYLPNVFSPNGDGINDEFYPMGTDFEVLELSVFDRWGGLRFRGSGPTARWTGGQAVQGTYVYRLVFKDLLNGKEEVLTGEVTLVR